MSDHHELARASMAVGGSVAAGLRARPIRATGKRAVDALLATTAMLVLLPLFIVVAVLVRATSRGPAFFRQTRVGRDMRPFEMWKFRTMYEDSDDAIHREFVAGLREDIPSDRVDGQDIYKLTHDPRITPLGRWLRRLSLDELPQLINVLLGTMSLVGPRPALSWELELFGTLPRYRDRFTVKPGITGLWQVSGRGMLTMREAVALDAEYVERRSFGLDLLILLRTIPAVLGRRGAF
jgi:lipopolysaccharide/colanic/teichoic acid biosynthesis glycosyltransferase